jgi:peptide/nickel transport system substrate-binding protein
MTRRRFLNRVVIAGASVPIFAGLLAACGGSDNTESTATATTASSGGTASSPTTAATKAAETSPTSAASSPTTGSASPETGSPTGSPGTGGTKRVEGGDRLMGKTIEPAKQEGGTLIWADNLDIRTLNPILQNDVPSGNVISLIMDRMIETNPDTLEPVGSLAESWEVNEDATSWTIYLRDGVKWHDGEAFSADDVKLTYDLFMNPESGSNQTSGLVSKVDSVDVVDDLTIKFTMKYGVVDFPIDLGEYAIIAAHIWKDTPPASVQQDPGSTGQDASRVVGTGPFKYKEWITSDHVTLTPNADYWDGAPHIDEFIYKIVPDSASAVQQLKTGEVDIFVGVDPSQVDQFNGTDVEIVEYPQLSFVFYGTQLDETKSTKFQDARVRQALFYAMDRQSVVDNIYFGYAEVAIGTLPTLSWAANPDGIKPELRYDFNVDKANQLLDEAGWVAGSDGIRAKDGQKLEFEMYGISSSNTAVQMLQVLQENWKAIGVAMTPHPEPFQELVSRITETFDFEVFMVGFSWDATPDQSPMWSCDSYGAGFNVVKYCNPKVDDLLKQAASEPDRNKRIELYTEFQNILLEDLPMAVPIFQKGLSGVNKRVHNFFANQQNRSFNAETWWVEQ